MRKRSISLLWGNKVFLRNVFCDSDPYLHISSTNVLKIVISLFVLLVVFLSICHVFHCLENILEKEQWKNLSVAKVISAKFMARLSIKIKSWKKK